MKFKILLLTAVVFTMTSKAQTWNCGYPNEADVKATLSNGTMTISGKGQMANYEWGETPWNSLADRVQTVRIEKGVTSIGDCTFSGFTSIFDLYIENTVENIGDFSFSGCSSLSFVNIPEGVKRIGDKAFNSNKR